MDGGHVRKRLDRCLAHVDWRIAFPHAIVEILAPHNFDHNLLLLMSCSKFKSNSVRSFQFRAHPDFNELILECGQGLMGMLFQSWPRYKSNMMILIKKKKCLVIFFVESVKQKPLFMEFIVSLIYRCPLI